jgi:hypothetical protein
LPEQRVGSGWEAARRLIKFYTVYKIAEMQRYREFRGFPP